MPSITGQVIGAGIGAIGSIGGALIGSNSASDAAQAQIQAAQLAIAEQQREYDLTRGDYAPWRTTGGSALDSLARLYGLDTYQNGQVVKGTGKTDFSQFQASPDYQFRMSQGIAGVDAGAAARGSLDSGATRKAEINYAGNLASGEFNNYANRLAGIAGVGQTAVAGTAQAGENAANQISQQYTDQGNALASSYLAQGNAYSNALSGLAGIGSGLISNNPQWFNTAGLMTPGGYMNFAGANSLPGW